VRQLGHVILNFYVDKIGIGVYNRIGTHQGGAISIPRVKLGLHPQGILGILSEYLSHKCGHKVVYS